MPRSTIAMINSLIEIIASEQNNSAFDTTPDSVIITAHPSYVADRMKKLLTQRGYDSMGIRSLARIFYDILIDKSQPMKILEDFQANVHTTLDYIDWLYRVGGPGWLIYELEKAMGKY